MCTGVVFLTMFSFWNCILCVCGRLLADSSGRKLQVVRLGRRGGDKEKNKDSQRAARALRWRRNEGSVEEGWWRQGLAPS